MRGSVGLKLFRVGLDCVELGWVGLGWVGCGEHSASNHFDVSLI